MYNVQVSARILTIPQVCCCCGHGDPFHDFRASSTRTTGKRVVRSETSSWVFPLCDDCSRWMRAQKASNRIFFMMGILAACSAMLLFSGVVLLRQPNGWLVLLCGVVGSVLTHFAVRSWRGHRRVANTMATSEECSLSPVVYHGWHGTIHSFSFANSSYCDQFVQANSGKVLKSRNVSEYPQVFQGTSPSGCFGVGCVGLLAFMFTVGLIGVITNRPDKNTPGQAATKDPNSRADSSETTIAGLTEEQAKRVAWDYGMAVARSARISELWANRSDKLFHSKRLDVYTQMLLQRHGITFEQLEAAIDHARFTANWPRPSSVYEATHLEEFPTDAQLAAFLAKKTPIPKPKPSEPEEPPAAMPEKKSPPPTSPTETPKPPVTPVADDQEMKRATQAATLLSLAKDLIKAKKEEAGRERLRRIVKEFPGTPAADEAKQMLDADK